MTLARDIRVLDRREAALVVACRVLGCAIGPFIAGLTLAQPPHVLMIIMMTSVTTVGMALATALVLWLRRSRDPLLAAVVNDTLIWSCCGPGLLIIFSIWADDGWIFYLLIQAAYVVMFGAILGRGVEPGWPPKRWRYLNTVAVVVGTVGALLLRQSQPDSGSTLSLLAVSGLFALVCGLLPALPLLQRAIVDTSSLSMDKVHQPAWVRRRLLLITMNSVGFLLAHTLFG